MSRVALGFKARTGKAILVVLAEGPKVIERTEVALLPEGEFAPYHAAEELEPAAAREHVAKSIATAQRMATAAIRGAAKRYKLCGCGVLIGPGMPDWTTDEILAVHFRMHKAEGELFRDVLVKGAKECGIALSTLPQKSPFDAAAKLLGVSRARLDADLAALGKSAGPPWGAHQKEAATAALVALANRRK